MKKPLFYFSSCAILVFVLVFTPLPDAFAGQEIVINTVVGGYDVFGNGDVSKYGMGIPGGMAPPGDNRVTVTGAGAVYGDVHGGYESSAPDVSVMGNNVTLENGGKIYGWVYGGYADSFSSDATVSENIVTISGEVDGWGVYGGWVQSRSNGLVIASKNVVEIQDSGEVNRNVYGGYAYSYTGSSLATENIVTINGQLDGWIYGGYVQGSFGDGIVSNNIVTISGGEVEGGSIYGGWSKGSGPGFFSLTATGNTVAITGGDVNAWDIHGGYTEGNVGVFEASNNILTISGGDVEARLHGGWATGRVGDATVTNNTISISGGEVNAWDIRSGWAQSSSDAALASNNIVSITGGTVIVVGTGIYGGVAIGDSASALGNVVDIQGSVSVTDVYGGRAVSEESYVGAAAAEGNSVIISGITVTGNVYGGYAEPSFTIYRDNSGAHTVSNNTVAITGSTVGGDVYGGYASAFATGSATVSNNTVTINDGTVTGDVHAGYVENRFGAGTGAFTVSNNTATVSGGTVTGDVYGGRADGGAGDAAAEGNSVNITGGEANGWVYGGWAESDTGAATASNNIVTITGGEVNGAGVTGGQADSTADAVALNNTVSITGGSINAVGGEILGGFARGDSASASRNVVEMHGSGSVTNVYGGQAESYTGDAAAEGNSVNITGVAVTGSVHGGYAQSDSGEAKATGNTVTITDIVVGGGVHGGWAESDTGVATASNNTITINGGTVTGDVYGGRAESASGSATATGNTLTIRGNPVFGAGTILYGGFASGAAGGVSANNTFNLYSPGVTVAGLQDFQNLNFYIPASLPVGGTMLNVTDTAYIDGTTVGIGIDGAHSPLRGGDYFVLIDATNNGTGVLDGQSDNDIATGQIMRVRQGATLAYDFHISTDNVVNQLWAYLPGGGNPVTPETESLSKGFLTGMSMLNQVGDLVAGWGMNSALNAAGEAAISGDDPGSFVAITGGKSRYDTGCHVDLSSMAFMSGLARRARFESGNLMTGAFFEYGTGSYDTYSTVHGQGDVYNFGGGVIGRMDFRNNFHIEGSARMGRVRNSYRNSEIMDALGREVRYNTASMYYGVHAGAGYTWNMTEKAKLDLYGKYFWTMQEGDTDHLSTGEVISFEGINSHRVRGGGRFSYIVNETHNVAAYVGGAYEYEFAGNAKGTTNGYSIGVPSLKGATGIGEIGVAMKPSKRFPLSIDAGVQGYTGQREGVSGILHLKYYF